MARLVVWTGWLDWWSGPDGWTGGLDHIAELVIWSSWLDMCLDQMARLVVWTIWLDWWSGPDG